MRRSAKWLLLIPVSTILPWVATAPASAAGRPAVSLAATHASVKVGQTPAFSYRATRVPARSVVTLQRQFGSARAWRAVRTVSRHAGVIQGVRLPSLGRYSYRMIVRVGSKVYATSATRAVYAFGNVSLGTLCAANQGSPCYTDDTPASIEVNGRIFEYQVSFGTDNYPSFDHNIKFANTTCRSIALRFTPSSFGQQDGDVSYIRVAQAASDPVVGSAAAGNIGTLAARLDGGSFYLDGSSVNGHNVEVTGSASCWTGSGTR